MKQVLILKLFLFLFILWGLTACGGGGSDPGPTSQNITGGGVKGPLANAVVTVYAFDTSQPDFKGRVVDTASTNAAAAITGLALPLPITPPYIMEFSSTPSTTDITTGQFPVITTLRTVITQSLLDGGEQIYATPLTTMAVDIAVAKSTPSTTASQFEAALTAAALQVVSTLGFGLDSSVDIFDTPPLIDNTTTSTQQQTNVAAYRAAVEAVTAVAFEISQQSSGDTDGVLAELAADLANDGVIDGNAGSQVNSNTLQVLQQDPATLSIPNTNQTVADVQAILVAEVTTTESTTSVAALDTGGSISTTPAPATTNPDTDGDGVLNANDAFPLNPHESTDTDGDGIGDNADLDDNGNGIPDIHENTTPEITATDTDGDGVADTADNCPNTFNPTQGNIDGDSFGDACDTDIDGDTVLNTSDAFPFDAAETIDTDGDGIGNNADLDKDNDGLSDADEVSAGSNPLVKDTDGDGVFDGVDFAPTDGTVAFNFAPVAVDDAKTVTEDAAMFSIAVMENDIDDGVPVAMTITAISTNDATLGSAVINDNDNNIDYTPVANASGVDSFTYTISDGVLTSTATVTVTITAVNDKPAFISTAVTAVDEDTAYSYTAAATDTETAALTLSAPTLPAWLTFTPATGVLTGTPLNEHVGTHNVVIRANDGTADVDQTFSITVANINDAPVLTADVVTVGVNTTTQLDVLLNDIDVDAGDSLTLTSVTPASAGTVVNNATFVTYTSGATTGTDSFTYTVTDAGGISLTATVNVTITQDSPPAFTSTAVTTVDEDAVYNYPITASDADGDTATITVLNKPDWLSFTPATPGATTTASLTGTPTNANVGGNQQVILRVTANGVVVDQSFTITVNNTNDAPTFTSNPVLSVTTGSSYTYTASVTDVDLSPAADTLTLTAPNLPNWLTFDPATRVLTGTPSPAHEGSHNVVIRVSDGTISVDQPFSITVNGLGVVTSISDLLGTAEGGMAWLWSDLASDTSGNIVERRFEYELITFDTTTNRLIFDQKIYDAGSNAFVANTQYNDDDLVLTAAGWKLQSYHKVEAFNVDGSADISTYDEENTKLLHSFKISARTVDIAGTTMPTHLDAGWQSAMTNVNAVFSSGAKLITQFRAEALEDSYLIYMENWCDPATSSILNGNCNSVYIGGNTGTSNVYATTLDQVIAATAWVNPNDGSTPPNAAHVARSDTQNITLKVELVAAGSGSGTANYYLIDWSNADLAQRVSAPVTGTWLRDSSVHNVEMIRYVVPESLTAQFALDLSEGRNFFLTVQNGFVRQGDYTLSGEVSFETGMDTPINGNALNDVLANFSAPASTGGGGDGGGDGGGTTTGLTCNYETPDGSFDSYTDFEAVIADCGGAVTTTDNDILGTWVNSFVDHTGATIVETVVYDINGTLSFTGTKDGVATGDPEQFNWTITNNLVTISDTANTFLLVWVNTTTGIKGYEEQSSSTSNPDLSTLDGVAEGQVFSPGFGIRQGDGGGDTTTPTGLTCGYESGWDETVDGGLGAPINPNSFEDYETVLEDCGAMVISVTDIAGKSFGNSGGEIGTFNNTTAAGTEADPETGFFAEGGTTNNFEWYIEAASCQGCSHHYLVVYSNPSIEPTYPTGFSFRETVALSSISGSPGVAGSIYSFVRYSEGSNFGDMIRATGADGEIWNSTDTLQ
jgi:hypothetical protein